MRKILIALIAACVITHANAQSVSSVFKPGGDLCSTSVWNSQTICGISGTPFAATFTALTATTSALISAAAPIEYLTQTGAGADLKTWDIDVTSGVFAIRTLTDALGAGQNVLVATRGATTALTDISFGYATAGTYTFLFTGAATFSGGATFGANVNSSSFTVTGSTCASGNRFYLPSANTPAICANGAVVAQFPTSGALLNAAHVSNGTTFTVTGCGTAASVSGGASAGTFTVGTGAATCTFVFTIRGASGITAPHGWIANVDDVTAKIHCANNGSVASTTTATALCNSTVTTGDLITFSAQGF